MEQDRRRDPRFNLRDGQSLEVSLWQGAGRTAHPVAARLVDISRGGAQLALASPVLFNHDATLRLKSKPLDLDLSLTAGMCWSRHDDEQGWLLGCAFNPRLPLEVLSRLLDQDMLDRRSSPRRQRRIPITARWELDPAPLPGYLWDVSQGGFCMLSPRRAGRHVTIAAKGMQRGAGITATAQWSLEVAGGFVVGCRLLEENDHTILTGLQDESDAPHGLSQRLRKMPSALCHAIARRWRRGE